MSPDQDYLGEPIPLDTSDDAELAAKMGAADESRVVPSSKIRTFETGSSLTKQGPTFKRPLNKTYVRSDRSSL